MKKLFLFAAIIAFVGGNAIAQNINIHAGFDYTTWSQKYKSDSESESLPGFYVGAGYNFNIVNNFNVEPSLDFMLITKKLENASESTTMMNIAVPVYFNYDLHLGNDMNLLFLAGPVFDLGLSAKTGDYDYYDKWLNRFDVKIGVGARFMISQFGINVAYQFGLLNMKKDAVDDYSEHFNRLMAGLSYNF